jgi:hypothetical protein
LVGATTRGISEDAPNAVLTQPQIFQKARDKYASLTSYSDQGKTIATVNGLTITTTFSIKLARPSLYRISWVQTNDSPYATTTTKPQSVWSAGDGDFLEMLGQGPKKQKNREFALSSATGISGGAAANIPGTFFKMSWGNQLGAFVSMAKQRADEKVGDVDCYVFFSESPGRSKTLWIGKQDFLIHQVRNETSAAAMQKVMDDAAKINPGAPHPPNFVAHDVASTETHTDIVLNPTLSTSDFTH